MGSDPIFGAVRYVRVHGFPQPFDEAVGASHTLVGPLERLLGRRGEHREQTGSIRAELRNNVFWFYDIVFGLGHLFDAAHLHWLTIALQNRCDRTAFVVVLHFDFIRVVPDFFTAFDFTVEGFIQQHALCEQAFEWFVNLHQTHVAHDFGPETGIQQMQYCVFHTADVLIDGEPVAHPLVHHGVALVGAGIADVVPRRIDERIHRVRLSPRRPSADRTGGVDERRHLRQRRVPSAGELRDARQLDGQLIVRHRHVAPMLSVVPLQLLAYYIGIAKELEVDKPRNLAKSVTVE